MHIRNLGPVIAAGITVFLFQTSAFAADTSAADRIFIAESRASAFQAENEQLKNAIATQAAALRRLDQQLIDLQNDQKAQAELQTRTQKLADEDLRQSQAAMNNRLQTQQANIQELQRALDVARSQQVQNQTQSSKQQKALQEELIASQQFTEAAKNEAARTKAQLAFVVERNNALQNAVSEATSTDEVLALRASVEQLQTKNTALSKAQLELTSDIERLQIENAALNKTQSRATSADEVLTMRASIKRLQMENDALNKAQSEATSPDEVLTMQASIKRLQMENDALSKAQSDATSADEVLTMQAAIKRLQTENDALNKAQSEAVSADEVEALQASMERVLAENIALTQAQSQAISSDEVAALQTSIERLQMEADKAQQSTNQQQQELAMLREENQLLQGGVAAAAQNREILSSARAENLALKRENAALVDGIQDCEARLSTAESAARQPAPIDNSAELLALQRQLSTANANVQAAKDQAAGELQMERSMNARSEAELEQSYQTQIASLKRNLQSCKNN